MFGFLRFRMFQRPQVATFAEHDKLVGDVVELFRMPVEQELCAPETTPVPYDVAPASAEARPQLARSRA